MSAERFVNGSLTLELRDEGPDVVVEWIGRSIASHQSAPKTSVTLPDSA